MSEEMKYDLSGVHAVNLKLLKEIDRICRKYKIKYALDSGTLLGAIRHGGFIPWDDDVDVVFTRANYEMFKKVARRELPEERCTCAGPGKTTWPPSPTFCARRAAPSRQTAEESPAAAGDGWEALGLCARHPIPASPPTPRRC